MKKSSLFALSVASLVALVGCGKQAASVPAGKKCALAAYSDLLGEKPGSISKDPAVYIEGTSFIDPKSDANEADLYLIDGFKDSWEFVFYLYAFDKTGEDEYSIVEDGTTYTFTLEQLNYIGNNTMYAFMAPEDEEEAAEAFTYKAGKWACSAVYEAIEENSETGSLISSYCEFCDAYDKDGEIDQDLITTYVDFIFYVVDYVDEDSSETTSYLFCTCKVLALSDLSGEE